MCPPDLAPLPNTTSKSAASSKIEAVFLDCGTFGPTIQLAHSATDFSLEVHRTSRPEQIVAHLHGALVAVTNKCPLTRTTLEQLPEALVEAIDNGLLSGVGLDCLKVEPPEDDDPILRICNRPNVLITPACGLGFGPSNEETVGRNRRQRFGLSGWNASKSCGALKSQRRPRSRTAFSLQPNPDLRANAAKARLVRAADIKSDLISFPK